MHEKSSNRPLKIGIDASCWSNGRGYGRFIREIMTQMVRRSPQDEFVCFLDPWTAKCFELADQANVRAVVVKPKVAPSQAAAAGGNRSPGDMLRFTRAVAKEPLDVFFFPSVYTYFPLRPFGKCVVAIHDTIAEQFPELTLPSARARFFWNAKVWLARKQADLILTVSDYSKGQLEKILGIDPAVIRVATEAPASEYQPGASEQDILCVTQRLGLPPDARWMVYVGGFSPHKYVDVIVRAHAQMRREHPDMPLYLLLVGSVDSDVFHGAQKKIGDSIAEMGCEASVIWTGFVNDDDLRCLHCGSTAAVLPSASEGFGLPAVEAAGCGSPVIVTTESPMPQLLEGGGIFIPPGDLVALSDAMRVFLDDESSWQKMADTALAQCRLLNWAKSADAAMQALREAAG